MKASILQASTRVTATSSKKRNWDCGTQLCPPSPLTKDDRSLTTSALCATTD